MKNLLFCAVLGIGLINSSFAQTEGEACLDLYRSKIKRHIGAKTYGGVAAAGVVVGLVSGMGDNIEDSSQSGADKTSGPLVKAGTYALVSVAALGVVDGVIAIKNAKPKKMISLIEESLAFKKNSSSIPGNLLKKLHSKVSNKINISVSELANSIVKANTEKSICSTKAISFNQLKRSILNGDFVVESSIDTTFRNDSSKFTVREVSLEENLKLKTNSVNKN